MSPRDIWSHAHSQDIEEAQRIASEFVDQLDDRIEAAESPAVKVLLPILLVQMIAHLIFMHFTMRGPKDLPLLPTAEEIRELAARLHEAIDLALAKTGVLKEPG